MHHHLWEYSAVIFIVIVMSKILSAKTSSVDVLWLIVFGAIGVNIGILPEHHEVLDAIGEWGILFVMFALGFDEDFYHFIKGVKKSFGIATLGAIFPFAAGYYTAGLFGFDFYSQMIWGLTMTATAVSLTMVSLRQENLHKSTASTAIMTAAVVDDILSLIGLAIVIPIILNANSGATNGVDTFAIAIIILKVIAFFASISFIGLVLFPDSLAHEKGKKHNIFFNYAVKIRQLTGIRKLLISNNGEFTSVIMVLVAFVFGAIANQFGFHPAIGAYFAGLFLKGEYFTVQLDKELISHRKESKKVIDHLAFTIFGPIFFVMLGTKLLFDFSVIINIAIPVLILFSLVLVFQILSASIAARFTGGYQWHESIMVGFGMLGRAELAFIVINIAYTQNQIITLDQFYILVATLFLLNITVPIAIKWWKPYYLGDKSLKLFGITLSKA
jgi:Kef-type K+ transport system membrane component KefB